MCPNRTLEKTGLLEKYDKFDEKIRPKTALLKNR